MLSVKDIWKKFSFYHFVMYSAMIHFTLLILFVIDLFWPDRNVIWRYHISVISFIPFFLSGWVWLVVVYLVYDFCSENIKKLSFEESKTLIAIIIGVFIAVGAGYFYLFSQIDRYEEIYSTNGYALVKFRHSGYCKICKKTPFFYRVLGNGELLDAVDNKVRYEYRKDLNAIVAYATVKDNYASGLHLEDYEYSLRKCQIYDLIDTSNPDARQSDAVMKRQDKLRFDVALRHLPYFIWGSVSFNSDFNGSFFYDSYNRKLVIDTRIDTYRYTLTPEENQQIINMCRNYQKYLYRPDQEPFYQNNIFINGVELCSYDSEVVDSLPEPARGLLLTFVERCPIHGMSAYQTQELLDMIAEDHELKVEQLRKKARQAGIMVGH